MAELQWSTSVQEATLQPITPSFGCPYALREREHGSEGRSSEVCPVLSKSCCSTVFPSMDELR